MTNDNTPKAQAYVPVNATYEMAHICATYTQPIADMCAIMMQQIKALKEMPPGSLLGVMVILENNGDQGFNIMVSEAQPELIREGSVH